MKGRAARHVILEGMFPRVKRERKTSPKEVCVWQRMVHKSETWVKRRSHSRQTREFKDAKHSEVQAGSIEVLDEKNPHIRNTRDGTMIIREQQSVHQGHVDLSQ